METSETNLTQTNAALPAIHVTGSHFDVGRAVGHTFSGQIHAMYDGYAFLQESLLPYFATQTGRDHYDALLAVNRAAFPGYVAELAGIAEGAGRPFHEVFLCNVRGEIYSAAGTDEQGCFDCAVVNDTVALLGHNEDGSPQPRVRPIWSTPRWRESRAGRPTAIPVFCAAMPLASTGGAFSFPLTT